ncbi:MAG: hypothetical protein ACLGSD_09205 [Acidobacteriota bacterium]
MQDTVTILTILVAAIGALVLIQAIVMFAMFVIMRKGMKAAGTYAEEMKGKISPLLTESQEMLATTKHLVARLEPKLEAAASDLAEMTRTASDEMKKIRASADEITERVRRQAARVDSMTSSVLDGADRAGHLLNTAVTVPVKQVSGVMAAVKAVVDALRAPSPRRRAQGNGHARPEHFA